MKMNSIRCVVCIHSINQSDSKVTDYWQIEMLSQWSVFNQQWHSFYRMIGSTVYSMVIQFVIFYMIFVNGNFHPVKDHIIQVKRVTKHSSLNELVKRIMLNRKCSSCLPKQFHLFHIIGWRFDQLCDQTAKTNKVDGSHLWPILCNGHWWSFGCVKKSRWWGEWGDARFNVSVILVDLVL